MNPADRDRKKAWKEQERQKAQAAFPLRNELLESLFAFVDAQVDKEGCDHTHRFTEKWVSENKQQRLPIFEWLEEHGGFCDCEVVANAQDHWEQNK
jgi:hypothetical protein